MSTDNDLWGETETTTLSAGSIDEGLSASDIVDPTTGEVVDSTSPDELIAALQRVKRAQERLAPLKATEYTLRTAIAKLTSGEAKTRRLSGNLYVAKVELSDDSWDQSILREAYSSYPKFRDDYLKIDTIKPKLAELKKLANTVGPDDLMTFKAMVKSANKGKTGTPTVTIEKGPE